MQTESHNAVPEQVTATKQETSASVAGRTETTTLLAKFKVGDLIKARLKQVINAGFRVTVSVDGSSVLGFIPKSRAGSKMLKRSEDIDVKVVDIDLKRQSLVLSVNQAQEKANFLGSVRIDQSIQGLVGNKAEFGWFVNVGCMDGLLHVSEVPQGKEPVKGGKLTMRIKSIDLGKQHLRLSLYEPGAAKSQTPRPAPVTTAPATADGVVPETDRAHQKPYRRSEESQRRGEEQPIRRSFRPTVRRRKEPRMPQPPSADAALIKKYAASSEPLAVTIGELFPRL